MVTNGIVMTMSAKRREKSLPAGEFKAKCLALLDEVEARGSSIIITKRGRPVARVVPLARATNTLVGSLLHDDDLRGPVDVTWEANS
jgi:prevent-host-death family protein